MVMVLAANQSAVLKVPEAAADCLLFQTKKIGDIHTIHWQMDCVQGGVKIVANISTEPIPVPYVQNKHSQALDCRTLSQAIDQVKSILQYAEHHVQKSSLGFRVARQSVGECPPRAASYARWHYSFDGKKIFVGRGKAHEIVTNQKTQDLPSPIAPCAADHQHATQYIEYIVRRRSSIDERLTRGQIPFVGLRQIRQGRHPVLRAGGSYCKNGRLVRCSQPEARQNMGARHIGRLKSAAR